MNSEKNYQAGGVNVVQHKCQNTGGLPEWDRELTELQMRNIVCRAEFDKLCQSYLCCWRMESWRGVCGWLEANQKLVRRTGRAWAGWGAGDSFLWQVTENKWWSGQVCSTGSSRVCFRRRAVSKTAGSRKPGEARRDGIITGRWLQTTGNSTMFITIVMTICCNLQHLINKSSWTQWEEPAQQLHLILTSTSHHAASQLQKVWDNYKTKHPENLKAKK